LSIAAREYEVRRFERDDTHGPECVPIHRRGGLSDLIDALLTRIVDDPVEAEE
jgi:hypothetical protein